MTDLGIDRTVAQEARDGVRHTFTASGRHPTDSGRHNFDCKTQNAANFKASMLRALGFEDVTVERLRKAKTVFSDDSLTAKEEMTFRRIANAGAPPSVLRPVDVEHLLALGWIKKHRRRIILTRVGKTRINKYCSLPQQAQTFLVPAPPVMDPAAAGS